MLSDSEKQIWHKFHVELTADGSPSLRLISGERPESMHHSQGACSETLYIYGEAMDEMLSKKQASSSTVWSVGLGLGYNEILWVIKTLLQVPQTKQAHEKASGNLISFEIEDELVQSFLSWVMNENPKSESSKIYDHVFTCIKNGLREKDPSVQDLGLDHVKQSLEKMYQNQNWKIEKKLDLDWIRAEQKKTIQLPRAELCLFDAFSQKTSPELWGEEFLHLFVETCLSKETCIWATYACTGTLRRVLLQNQFQVTKKPGFHGKRDSTWAIRFRS